MCKAGASSVQVSLSKADAPSVSILPNSGIPSAQVLSLSVGEKGHI